MVDDDDGDESPSPEPRTDSRSALPREIRAWRRLHIVKRDETSSMIFFLREMEYMELELRSAELQGAQEIGGRAQRGWAPPILVDRVWAPGLHLLPVFFIFSETCLRGFSGHSENFLFSTHKTTSWVILLKTTSVRVSFIQIMQVRVQNKGKRVWKSRYVGDVSAVSVMSA